MSISSTVTTTIPGVLAVGVFGNSPTPTPTPTPNPTPTPTPEPTPTPTPNPTPTPTPNPTPTEPTYDNDYGYAEVDYGWDNKDGASLNIAAVPFDNEHYWYEGSPAVPNYGSGKTFTKELTLSGVANAKLVSRLMAQDNDNLYFMTIAQKYAKVGNVYKGHFLIRTIVSKANPSQSQNQYFNLQTLLPVSFNLFDTNVELVGLVASKLFVVFHGLSARATSSGNGSLLVCVDFVNSKIRRYHLNFNGFFGLRPNDTVLNQSLGDKLSDSGALNYSGIFADVTLSGSTLFLRIGYKGTNDTYPTHHLSKYLVDSAIDYDFYDNNGNPMIMENILATGSSSQTTVGSKTKSNIVDLTGVTHYPDNTSYSSDTNSMGFCLGSGYVFDGVLSRRGYPITAGLGRMDNWKYRCGQDVIATSRKLKGTTFTQGSLQAIMLKPTYKYRSGHYTIDSTELSKISGWYRDKNYGSLVGDYGKPILVASEKLKFFENSTFWDNLTVEMPDCFTSVPRVTTVWHKEQNAANIFCGNTGTEVFTICDNPDTTKSRKYMARIRLKLDRATGDYLPMSLARLDEFTNQMAVYKNSDFAFEIGSAWRLNNAMQFNSRDATAVLSELNELAFVDTANKTVKYLKVEPRIKANEPLWFNDKTGLNSVYMQEILEYKKRKSRNEIIGYRIFGSKVAVAHINPCYYADDDPREFFTAMNITIFNKP